MGDGTDGFRILAADRRRSSRFNKDLDLDGYSDRSEARLGTNPTDASSYPHPGVLAGVHSIRNGSGVTATLSLLNTSSYDAYGVEAVMIALDDQDDLYYLLGDRPVRRSRRSWSAAVSSPFRHHLGVPQSRSPQATTQVQHGPCLHIHGIADRLVIGVDTRQLSWSDGRAQGF